MKYYQVHFFFPTQPPIRQNYTVRCQGSNTGVALARAWRELKHQNRYKGRKGLDNVRIGVVGVKTSETEEAAGI